MSEPREYRGKTEQGEWVYGFYLVAAGMPFISQFGVTQPTKVIPSTVGQFVGKTDKDSDKIFAGDYLGDWCIDDNGNEIFGHYGVVTYWEDECRWVLTDENGLANDWTDESEARPENWHNLYRMGNIHEKGETE